MSRLGDDKLSVGYTSADEARYVAELPKRADRTAFARDRARILHSSALRRLAAKTQVLQAGTADFPRTRLTHTLEVAQVGRELGQSLGCDPDLVEVGCLAHDLGHPPFGHNGEDELNRLAGDIGGFEGNAQTLRVLARLESKTFDHDGRSVGLNLTRAALDAALKYPWGRQVNERKFGYYADDEPIFAWVREGAPELRKCFEAQVMDWADDVAYSVHDVEDAVHSGHLDLATVALDPQREALIALCQREYLPSANAADLGGALDRLTSLQFWPQYYDGSQQSLAALKNLTSYLIGRFCQAADSATRAEFGDGPLTRYNASLLIPAETRQEVAVLKSMAMLYVMQRRGAAAVYEEQRRIISELVQMLAGPDARAECFEPWLRPVWSAALSNESRLRVVIDQVASLTDISVREWHARYVRNA
jgi:dGTPase